MDFILGTIAGITLTIGSMMLVVAVDKIRKSRAPRRSRVRSTYVAPRHAKATRSSGRHRKN